MSGGNLSCFATKKKTTVDCLIVTLKFAVAETQSIVMITHTIVNNDNKIYNC